MFTGVELQPAHARFGVTGVALLCQQGADLRLEEIGVNGTRRRLSK